MSLPEWVLPFKEPRTEIKCINKHYYKYEVKYIYDKEKKRTIKKTTKLLGKISATKGFIPSSKNLLREEANKQPKVDIKRFGVYNLFKDLLKDEISGLQSTFGKDIADQLLSFSMMRLAYQSPIKRVADYHSHDFASEDWCNSYVLSDKKISACLKYIGENREKVVDWLIQQMPRSSAENFILMDSTHVMSASEYLELNAKGYNSSLNFEKQIRLMYMFSSQKKTPVYYRSINGNINDISSMSLCLKETGVENAILVADKGFYSENNVELLEKQGLQYIIPVKRNSPLVNYLPLETGDFQKKYEYFIYQDKIIWFFKYKKNGRDFITFFDEQLAVEEKRDYLQNIERYPEDFSKEKFYQKLHGFGTITITHNIKNENSPEQIYSVYKQRNQIEVMFNSYKNFLEADKTYMQNRMVLEGWLFANFLAMIAYCRLYNRLQSAGISSKYSPKDIIEICKSIHKIRMKGQWITAETTKKIDKLLAQIGLTT
jgi:transposase